MLHPNLPRIDGQSEKLRERSITLYSPYRCKYGDDRDGNLIRMTPKLLHIVMNQNTMFLRLTNGSLYRIESNYDWLSCPNLIKLIMKTSLSITQMKLGHKTEIFYPTKSCKCGLINLVLASI